jgi:hypothetical protein
MSTDNKRRQFLMEASHQSLPPTTPTLALARLFKDTTMNHHRRRQAWLIHPLWGLRSSKLRSTNKEQQPGQCWARTKHNSSSSCQVQLPMLTSDTTAQSLSSVSTHRSPKNSEQRKEEDDQSRDEKSSASSQTVSKSISGHVTKLTLI